MINRLMSCCKTVAEAHLATKLDSTAEEVSDSGHAAMLEQLVYLTEVNEQSEASISGLPLCSLHQNDLLTQLRL